MFHICFSSLIYYYSAVMKKAAVLYTGAFFVFVFGITVRGQEKSGKDETRSGECSSYFFHSFRDTNESLTRTKTWINGKELCHKRHAGELVSMETDKEWKCLINFTDSESVTSLKIQFWYIGLRKYRWWCWSSSEGMCAKAEQWPWQEKQPSSREENCAEMATNSSLKSYGLYNDVKCTTILAGRGYICEKKVDCNKLQSYQFAFQWSGSCTMQPPTTVKTPRRSVTQTPFPREFSTTERKKSSTEGQKSKSMQPPATMKTLRTSVTQKPFTREFSTTERKKTSTEGQKSKPNTESTLPTSSSFNEAKTTSKSGTVVMIASLSAVFLLAILMLCLGCVIWRHRAASKESKGKVPARWYQVDRRDDGIYEEPMDVTQSSPEPAWRVSTLTVEELETCEGVNLGATTQDDKEDYTYANVENARARTNTTTIDETVSTNEHIADIHAQSSTSSELCQKVEKYEMLDMKTEAETEEKGPVYAAVHKACSRPGSARDELICQGLGLDTRTRLSQSLKRGKPVEHDDRMQRGEGLEANKSFDVHSSKADEGKDNLYAVVDKAQKKPTVPKKPALYKGLVYAELNLNRTPENSAGPVRRNSYTLYSDIDHHQTARKSRITERDMDQLTDDEDP